MNHISTTVAALALALITVQPAGAQNLTGTVNLTGFVAARCVTGGSYLSTVGGSIGLGELADSDATLSNVFEGSSETTPAGTAEFYAGCSSTAFRLTMSATRLSTPSSETEIFISKAIDYTAQIRVAEADGGFAIAEYRTAVAAPIPTVLDVTSFVANVDPNIELRIFDLEAENGATSYLSAGSYMAIVSFTLSPQ